MRLIDADALYEKATDLWDKSDSEDFEKGIFKLILNAPTIDAVEVVRCRECRHSRIEGNTTMFMWCGYWNKPTDGIRHCSDGERREP